MNIKYIIENNRRKISVGCISIVVILVIVCIYTLSNNKPTNYPEELVRIDSLFETQPQTAKAELDNISYRYKTADDESGWYYRFLEIKAKVKLNKETADISETNAITNHYEQEGNKKILPQVYYCAGCIYRNLKDITTSNQYFIKSLDAAKEISDNTLLLLCHYQLGYNFSIQGLYKEALPYQLKSLQYNKEYNNMKRILSDYEELAWSYGSIGNKSKAFEYIKKANSLAYSVKDSNKISETECQLAVHYMEYSQLNKAKRHIDIALNRKNKNNLSALYSTALEIYSRLGNNDTAKIFCDSTITNGNIYGKKYAYWWLAVYYNQKGEQQATHYCIQKYKEYSDSVSNAVAAEASAKANALYNYSVREKENITLKNENTIKTLYIIIVLSLLVIVILLSVTIYKKIARKKRAIEKRYHMLIALREKENKANEHALMEKEEEIKNIREMLASIKNESQDRIELNNILIQREKQLCEISNDMMIKKLSDSYLKKTEIYKRIISLSESNSPIKFDDWDELKQALFNIYTSFEDKLSELHSMNDTELKTCLLIKTGLNSAKIARFLNKSQNTIYSIKRRLYQKNFGDFASPSEWEKFIMTIY